LGQEVIESHSTPAIIDTGTTLIITSYSIAQDYENIPRATAHTEGEDAYWTSKHVTHLFFIDLISRIDRA
jgi:hypothetical protein